MDVDALRHLTGLFLITLLLGIISTVIVGGIIVSVMGEIPANVNGTLAETDVPQLILLGVLIAPILEEIIFRSWLGFPRSSVLGFPMMVCVLSVLTATTLDSDAGLVLPIAAGLGLLLVLVIRQFWMLSEDDQIASRRRLFPIAFWGTMIVFGLIHLSNFEGGVAAAARSPILFLAVAPQIIAGAVLGYVRMRFGLVQAILFHMVYNGVLITMAVMAANAAPVETTAENLAISGLALLQWGGPLP